MRQCGGAFYGRRGLATSVQIQFSFLAGVNKKSFQWQFYGNDLTLKHLTV